LNQNTHLSTDKRPKHTEQQKAGPIECSNKRTDKDGIPIVHRGKSTIDEIADKERERQEQLMQTIIDRYAASSVAKTSLACSRLSNDIFSVVFLTELVKQTEEDKRERRPTKLKK
jgi:hypothetical protein